MYDLPKFVDIIQFRISLGTDGHFTWRPPRFFSGMLGVTLWTHVGNKRARIVLQTDTKPVLYDQYSFIFFYIVIFDVNILERQLQIS